MKFLVLLAACTLACALVPRDRRAVNTEEEEEQLSKIEVTTPTPDCAPRTPCQWIMYNQVHHEDLLIVNKYCVCGNGESCVYTENDTSVFSYVYRCRDLSKLGEELVFEDS